MSKSMSVQTKLRPRFSKKRKPGINATERVFTFETTLGWIGIAHVDQVIRRVKFGYKTEPELLAQFDLFEVNHPGRHGDDLDEFERDLKNRFTQFAAGEPVEFDDLDIDQTQMTPFQRSVTDSCRAIPYGETLSYGGLAAASGSPRAARAVGSVMSNNRFPLIVPCHRVVSGGGRIGGFSAPRGVNLKLKLLKLEGATIMKTLTILLLGISICVSGCADPYAADKPAEKKRENIIGKKTQDIGEFDADDDDFAVRKDENPKLNPINPLASMKAYGTILQKVSKMHIQQAVNLFQAEHGRYPKDHEEFMTKIIKQNNIELPVLPGKYAYQYDVKKHELVVVAAKEEK